MNKYSLVKQHIIVYLLWVLFMEYVEYKTFNTQINELISGHTSFIFYCVVQHHQIIIKSMCKKRK